MPTGFDDLRADVLRYFPTGRTLGRTAIVRRILLRPGFQAVAVYRLGHWLRGRIRQPAWWLPAVLLVPGYAALQLYVRWVYDIHLDPRAEIGAGLYIGHFGGIRLTRCRVGCHCAIQQEVQVLPAATAAAGPEIGDHVWIGAHAEILGPVRVGERVTVGAGAVVSQDVPAGCLVLGDPARVVRWNYDNSSFL